MSGKALEVGGGLLGTGRQSSGGNWRVERRNSSGKQSEIDWVDPAPSPLSTGGFLPPLRHRVASSEAAPCNLAAGSEPAARRPRSLVRAALPAPPSVHSSVSALFCPRTAPPAWDLRGGLDVWLPWAPGVARPAGERGEPTGTADRGGGYREARADSGAEGHPRAVRKHRGEEPAGGRGMVQVQGARAQEGLRGPGRVWPWGEGAPRPLMHELPLFRSMRTCPTPPTGTTKPCARPSRR